MKIKLDYEKGIPRVIEFEGTEKEFNYLEKKIYFTQTVNQKTFSKLY